VKSPKRTPPDDKPQSHDLSYRQSRRDQESWQQPAWTRKWQGSIASANRACAFRIAARASPACAAARLRIPTAPRASLQPGWTGDSPAK
jgi:hypothetical protein